MEGGLRKREALQLCQPQGVRAHGADERSTETEKGADPIKLCLGTLHHGLRGMGTRQRWVPIAAQSWLPP